MKIAPVSTVHDTTQNDKQRTHRNNNNNISPHSKLIVCMHALLGLIDLID